MLKATKKRAPRKQAKPKLWQFLKDDHGTEDEKQFGANVIYRKFEGIKKFYSVHHRKDMEYRSYDTAFYINKGRSVYKLGRIKFFDKKGVKFEVKWIYFDLKKSFNRVELSQALTLKKAEDFSEEKPYMVSRGKYSYEKHARANVYLPMSYLKEIGYKITEEVKEDEQKSRKKIKKLLVTPWFQETLEERVEEDFEAMKQKLLKELKKAKRRKDVAEIFDRLTPLSVPGRYVRGEAYDPY